LELLSWTDFPRKFVLLNLPDEANFKFDLINLEFAFWRTLFNPLFEDAGTTVAIFLIRDFFSLMVFLFSSSLILSEILKTESFLCINDKTINPMIIVAAEAPNIVQNIDPSQRLHELVPVA
jgi:hypothetical protein